MTQAALVTLGDQIRSDQKKKKGGGRCYVVFLIFLVRKLSEPTGRHTGEDRTADREG